MHEITVVITVWKRNYLEEQLRSLISQSYAPKEIIILQNESHLPVDDIISIFRDHNPRISILKSNRNLKYFFRFTVTLLIETEYLFLIDDDIIPGAKWLETCVQCSKKYNAVIACSGRIIPKNDYLPEVIKTPNYKDYFIGDCFNDEAYNYCQVDTQVDFGCNSYFLKTEWLKYFWVIWPSTFLSGEDIHLSATLMVKAAIPTVVPQQLTTETSGNTIKEYGRDQHSSWKQNGFFEIRKDIFSRMISEEGWVPLQWK